ncbi:VRR-NUC domain-containing protein [Aliarcobacter butzleri]
MKESEIQKKIIQYLNTIGAYTIKTISTNRNGCPDVICCLNGRFIALEVKTDKGIVSKLQEHNIKQIKNSGGIAEVVRSVDDVEKIVECLNSNDQG